jgi:hypothetical protein
MATLGKGKGAEFPRPLRFEPLEELPPWEKEPTQCDIDAAQAELDALLVRWSQRGPDEAQTLAAALLYDAACLDGTDAAKCL